MAMAPTKKPDFLKTFSDFTIAELRSMPVRDLMSLFVAEVKSTFSEGKPVASTPKTNKKTRAKRGAKQKVTKPTGRSISLPRLHFPTQSLSSAVKRIFTFRPVGTTGAQKTEEPHLTDDEESSSQAPSLQTEEMVVFTETSSLATKATTHTL